MNIKRHTTIGRLNVVSPKDHERFSLKLILNKVRGAISFESLKTFENTNYSTFRDTAIAMGLLEHDSQIVKFFEEACTVMLPIQLRQFFAWFLLSENIQGIHIWNNYKNSFTEDFKDNKENFALLHINQILETEDKSCESFHLPMPKNNNIHNKTDINKEILYCTSMYEKMYIQLNNDQRNIFKILCEHNHKMYFIDGPGGFGKTFLYKTLIYYFISLKKQILSMAWTGIALILLPKGMTSHRTFRLPLNLSTIEISFLQFQSDKKNYEKLM